jgi:hypothetical protein
MNAGVETRIRAAFAYTRPGWYLSRLVSISVTIHVHEKFIHYRKQGFIHRLQYIRQRQWI